MTFAELPDELRDALGPDTLAKLAELPDEVQATMASRIMALPDEASKLEACRRFGDGLGVLSVGRENGIPAALSLLLATAMTGPPSEYAAKLTHDAASMGAGTFDDSALALTLGANAGVSGGTAVRRATIAVYVVTMQALATATALLLTLDADTTEDGAEHYEEGFGLDLSDGVAYPNDVLDNIAATLSGERARDEYRENVVPSWRTSADRGGLERDVLADLADLPTLDHDPDA